MSKKSLFYPKLFCKLVLLVLRVLQDSQVQELKLVNLQDSTGATALHYAAQGGFLKVRFKAQANRFKISIQHR